MFGQTPRLLEASGIELRLWNAAIAGEVTGSRELRAKDVPVIKELTRYWTSLITCYAGFTAHLARCVGVKITSVRHTHVDRRCGNYPGGSIRRICSA